MKQDDFLFYSATKIAKLIRNGELTSEQVTKALIQRIQTHDSKVNAVVNKDLDQVLMDAKRADEELKKGLVQGPLHGVPITFKESYAIKGMKTTSGFTPFKEYTTDFDATIVRRLKEAGAIIVGKTNVPPLLMDLQTDNEIYGRTNNPWDLNRTPGGSSGGGAAAVASCFSYLDIGSDIGGSLRIPAHYCGVYSLKPTEHAVPAFGHFPMPYKSKPPEYRSSRHLACYGPLARSIDDLILAFSTITGSDPNDMKVPPLNNNKPDKLNLNHLKIAWMDQLSDVPVAKEVKDHIYRFVEKLKSLGIQTVKIEQFPESTNKVWETWGKMIDAELNSGKPSILRGIEHIFTRNLQKKYPTSSKLMPLTFKNYMKILTQRENLISSFDMFMDSYEMFILPVSVTAAFPHIKKDKLIGHQPIYKNPVYVDGKPMNYWQATGAYTNLFNVLTNPVVTMPIGLNKDNMPLGVQCVGKRWDDFKLLHIVNQLVSEMDMDVPIVSF
ncbi:amidase [Chengkuizengella sediminis]|uniref:amidase n=1 Tax=Chengkuizengella sediminis TaxID=1885917 RepID=UPI00138A1922|nr:amidase [Chengkuizengella sediminis]NDI35134.1 amidase [Chengkuizengella sediminis]